MARLNILVAAGIYPPTVGGPSTHLAQLLPQLRARGHGVRVVAFGDPAITGDEFPVTRVAVRSRSRMLRWARAFRTEAGWADVVYATSMGLPRGRGARPLLLRIPGDIAWERAVNRRLVPPSEDIDTFDGSRHGARVSLLKWLRRREAQRAERIVVPSQYLRRLVEGWGVDSSRIVVVHSAIDQRTTDPGDPKALRRRFGWDDTSVHVVAPARLTPWKGFDMAIDAVSAVPGVRLTVLGDGPSRAGLEAQARARRAPVTFAGDCAPEDVRAYLQAADYCLVYSGYEGLSHTILESLSAGTPVIASRRGGNPEVVVDGVNGVLVDHPDVEALAAALRTAVDTAVRTRLRAGAAQALDRFSVARAADGIANELERLAGRRR